MDLEKAHESIIIRVLDAMDLRTRTAVLCTCSRLKRMCERPSLWRRIAFDSADEQRGLKAEWLLGVLGRAGGGVEVLHLARSREARDAEGAQRFSDGFKFSQLLPHTQGACARALAGLCPRLVHLSIDERASCLGGMTDDLARALGRRCPQLESLEVYFERYSFPTELLTDEGVIALSEGCRRLSSLVLVNCDYVSDRSLYAVAANCKGLRELQLGGYSENITDGGLTVLVESCGALTTLWLSGKLLKVTDATLAALAAHRRAGLARAKLTRSMGAAAALALLASCRELEELDLRHCGGPFDEAAVASLAAACPKLSRLALPPPPRGDDGAGSGSGSGSGCGTPLAGGGAAGSAADLAEEEEEDQGRARLAPGCSAGGARMLLEADVRRLQALALSSH
ncbi:MAG: hypothetical protein J3K34DRAFT_517768 [Monoraphidium minutum]|nr:MAG: hypothetical protein J3K34DRAFT_517768 [Monoraphidium minutum]